jgi:zinc protease
MNAAVQAFEVDALPVLLKSNPAHEVVAVRLYVRGGAGNLDAWTAGAEIFYARTARRGTRRFPKADLNAQLAGLGAEVGFTAGDDYTVFHLRTLRRHFDTAWQLYTDIVLDPVLQPEDLEVVRQQMLLEIRQLHDNPDSALGERARRHCYAGHPYAPDPHGTELAVQQLDAAALRRHMQRVLVRRNLLLAVVGDVQRADLEAGIGATLARLPAGDAPQPLAPPLQFESGSVGIVARDLPTQYVLGQFAAPGLGHADYEATLVAMSVLRDRLFEEVRTKRNLSYAPSASLGHSAANLGAVYVTAVDPVAALAVMRDEMRRLQQEPVDPKELADKIRVFVTRYWMQNETNQAQAGFLGAYAILAGGWSRSLEFVARLEATTPADVQRAAQTCLRRIQWTYLGDSRHADARALVDP